MTVSKAGGADAKYLRRRAIAAADAVETLCLGQPNARGKHARADAKLLDRIRSKKYYQMVIDAWGRMQKCGATPEQEQQVIKAMLEARLHAEIVPQLAADPEMERTLKSLKESADVLYDYFEHMREAFYGQRRDDVLRLLSWIQRLFEEKLGAFSETVRGPKVNRQLQAATARRVLFMIKMSEAMVDILHEPLNEVVAWLTDVALECAEPTSANQVAQARRREKARRGVKRD
jgi:hypothetical protein